MSLVFADKERCCGCTACYSGCPVNAITMKADSEGFLYPEIDDDKCINCNKCRINCDFNCKLIKNREFLQKVYGFKHVDNRVLKKSTSGGAFTSISDFILNNKGVVFGAIYDSDLNVVHRVAFSKSERDSMCGAKYVQSSLGDSLKKTKEFLDAGIPVLFSGTPCQIAGLKSYLRGKVYKNLYTIDVVCHSIASPLMFSEYIKFVEAKTHKKILRHECRGKQDGWRTNENNVFVDGSEDRTSRFSQLHRRLFFKNVADRPSCYNCKYTSTIRVGDLTLGDFWGIEKEIPDFYSNNGVSLVLVNTEKGEKLFNEIKNDGEFIESDMKHVLPAQPHLQRPVIKPVNRERFWTIYYNFGYYEAIKYVFYRPFHEGLVDFLKAIGVFNFLLRLLGKQ